MSGFIRQPKDFLAGLLFLAIGGLFLADVTGVLQGALSAFGVTNIGGGYGLGNVRRMGPGWFPTVVCWMLIAFGAATVAKSFVGRRTAAPTIAWKPLAIVLASLGAFALLLRPAGILVSVFVLVLGSAYAYPPVRLVPMIMAAVGLAAFCAIVFVRLLGLPFPVLGPWLGGY